MEGLSDEEWPAWTSRQSELLIDGLTVTQVFSNVHIQLETLRKRRFATKSGVLFEDELNNLANKMLKLSGGGADKIPPLEQKLKVVERRLDGLDDSVSDKSDIQKLEIKLGGRIDGLERRLSAVEAAVAQLGGAAGGDNSSLQARLEALEKSMEGMAVKVPTLEDTLLKLLSQFEGIRKQMDVIPKKVSELSDSCSINQYKIDGLEKLLSDLQTGYDRLKIVIDGVTEECLRRVRRELAAMDEVKADRADLSCKADLSQLHLKADLSEVSLLNDLSNQLDRRIDSNKADFNDSLKTLRSNYDKRLEALLQWILKQLRRLAGTSKKGETGTDIGKVKCLVCDQVVNQAVDTEIVFGGPALPISLKTLTNHRPMAFENDTDPRRTHSAQQPWSRGPNKSPSPPRANQQSSPTATATMRLSSANLETLAVDRGFERTPHQRERPRSATSHRTPQGQGQPQYQLDRDRSMSVSSMAGMAVLDQTGEGYEGAPNGEYKLSHFKELELRRGDARGSRPSLAPEEGTREGTRDSRPQSAPAKRQVKIPMIGRP